MEQFYNQALQQVVVDDRATNARAVVKTSHETHNCCDSHALTSLTTSVLKNSLCPSDSTRKLLQEFCHQKNDHLLSGKLYLIGFTAIVVAMVRGACVYNFSDIILLHLLAFYF